MSRIYLPEIAEDLAASTSRLEEKLRTLNSMRYIRRSTPTTACITFNCLQHLYDGSFPFSAEPLLPAQTLDRINLGFNVHKPDCRSLSLAWLTRKIIQPPDTATVPNQRITTTQKYHLDRDPQDLAIITNKIESIETYTLEADGNDRAITTTTENLVYPATAAVVRAMLVTMEGELSALLES